MNKFFLPAVIMISLMVISCNNNGRNGDATITNTQTEKIEKEEVLEDLTKEEILDFVETWKNLYTSHTYDNYIKLYDPVHFKGIKRTFKGERNVYDYEGWQKNKVSEFRKYEPEIIVENVKVKYLNREGKSKVSFIQTWISYKTNYADSGEKVLILKKVNGEIIIEKEELLYSQPAYDYLGGCYYKFNYDNKVGVSYIGEPG